MDLSDASEKIPSDTTGVDPGTFRQVAQRLNHYATLHIFMRQIIKGTACCVGTELEIISGIPLQL